MKGFALRLVLKQRHKRTRKWPIVLVDTLKDYTYNRPLSHGGHFEPQENKKLCFCTSSLALDERLAVQNLLLSESLAI